MLQVFLMPDNNTIIPLIKKAPAPQLKKRLQKIVHLSPNHTKNDYYKKR